jgi:hypothetical protein
MVVAERGFVGNLEVWVKKGGQTSVVLLCERWPGRKRKKVEKQIGTKLD